MSFPAKWRFKCACCGTWMDAGTEAAYDDHNSLRAIDPDHTADTSENVWDGAVPSTRYGDAMPRGKTVADRCDTCFIVHSPGQTECY